MSCLSDICVDLMRQAFFNWFFQFVPTECICNTVSGSNRIWRSQICFTPTALSMCRSKVRSMLFNGCLSSSFSFAVLKKSDSWFSLFISIPKIVPLIAYCAKYIIIEGCTVASSFWHLRRFVHYAWLLNVQSTISSYFYIHLYLWWKKS